MFLKVLQITNFEVLKLRFVGEWKENEKNKLNPMKHVKPHEVQDFCTRTVYLKYDKNYCHVHVSPW